MEECLETHLLAMLASVAPRRGCAYVAGPLATGKVFYDRIASGKQQLAATTREENELLVSHFVKYLRNRVAYPVIDPGVLRISQWSSKRMGDFFLQIIEVYAKEAWFINGWEFSRGATKEYVHCLFNNIPCLDETGMIITADNAAAMIQRTVDYLRGLGIDGDRFEERIDRIRSFR